MQIVSQEENLTLPVESQLLQTLIKLLLTAGTV